MAVLGSSGWSEESLAKLLGPIPTGATVETNSAAVGPFGVAVLVGVTAACPARGLPSTANVASTPTALSLLVSRDAATWSATSLDKLAGGSVTGASSMAVTANRFIVTATFPVPQQNAPVPETVLVGTAR